MPPKNSIEKVPSGYESSESLDRIIAVGGDVLPWLDQNEKFNLHISKLDLTGVGSFLVASAIGSNRNLVSAASGLTEHQSNIVNNMFYSRLAGFISNGQSASVETFEDAVTPFPIKVMRNNGGQRVYFARVALGIPEEDEYGATVLRLAVCDKNEQLTVMKILSSGTNASIRKKMKGSK
jgi:hypothetical protein